MGFSSILYLYIDFNIRQWMGCKMTEDALSCKPTQHLKKILNQVKVLSLSSKSGYVGPSLHIRLSYLLGVAIFQSLCIIYLKACIYGAICICMQNLHMYANRSMCTHLLTYAKFACMQKLEYFHLPQTKCKSHFAYMQIWSCERKTKFAHVSIYLIVINSR